MPMEDFGGFEAGDAWEADEAEPVDPDAFPCFVNPVAGFTPRAEVEARAAERFADAEPEDEEWRAPAHRASTPSLPAAVTRSARRGGPRAPPRPDAAQRHAADPALPPPAVAGHRRGGGHFTEKKARGPPSGARGALRGGGGPRTYRRGVERFCAVLLRWSVRALAEREHDPTAVGLPPLPEPVTRFESPEHYFDVQRAVALEEARAALARASARFFFSEKSRAFTEKLSGTSASSVTTSPSVFTKRRYEILLRAVPSEAGGAERSETGVLAAEALAAATCDARARRRDGGEEKEKEKEKVEWRRPGTVLALRRVRADGTEDEPELAIVTGSHAGADARSRRANGAASAGLGVPADANATTVPLWMASSSRMFREPFREPTGGERNDRRDRFVTAELYVLDTVVSQMRIAAAAHTRPSPPFLHELLGSRRAGAHVRFASDDDDEELGDARDRRSVLDEAKRKKHEARLATERAHHESLALGTPLASLNDAQRRAGCLFAEGVLGSLNPKRTRSVSTAREENAEDDVADDRNLDSDETHLEADDEDEDEDDDDVDRYDATAAFSSRSRRLHLVQGPPGCGKTKFVAATLRALVERPTSDVDAVLRKRKRKRFRVLLCAPSNKAVTVALERFLATIETIGPASSRRPFPLLVGVEEALELACAKDEGDENENEGSETTTTNAASSRARGTAEPRNRVMDFFVHRRCGVLADRLAARAERLLETHVSYASREAYLKNTSDARSVLAAIRATLEELERLAPAFLAADGFRAKLNGAEATTNKWLAEASASHTTDALFRTQEITVSPETRSLFRARLTETCAMLREGSGKGSRADMFAEQAVLRSDVVFATLSSSGQAILSRADNFDALVVDEAAQALECELVVALARKPKRCLLVGDPAQLPATMASDAARRQGHDRSCMRRLLDAAAEDASRASHASHASHDSWYTLLDTQYRMHPAISSFPSRRFYESSVRDAGSTQTVPFFLLPERVSTRDKAVRLERTGRVRRDDDHANARVTKKREALRSWLRAPFAFVDVPFAAGSRSETRGSSFARGGANAAASLGNDAEAELAAALARALPWAMGGANDATRRDAFERSSSAASSVARADSDSDSSFPDSSSDDATRRIDVAPSATRITSAVITFYSEQVRRLRRELEARGSLANALAGPHEISCGSVPRRAKETKETFSAKRRKTFSKTKTPPKTSREDHFRQRDSSRFPPPAVHTVDSFQGSEADVVVISAVRCNARGDVGFLADPRRLNVALTRAKSACVFVGCVRTLRASGSADLRALVRDAERRGLIATEAEARAWLELHK